MYQCDERKPQRKATVSYQPASTNRLLSRSVSCLAVITEPGLKPNTFSISILTWTISNHSAILDVVITKITIKVDTVTHL